METIKQLNEEIKRYLNEQEYGLEQVGKELEKIADGKFMFFPQDNHLEFTFDAPDGTMFMVNAKTSKDGFVNTYTITDASDYTDENTYVNATIASNNDAEKDAKEILNQFHVLDRILEKRASGDLEEYKNYLINDVFSKGMNSIKDIIDYHNQGYSDEIVKQALRELRKEGKITDAGAFGVYALAK